MMNDSINILYPTRSTSPSTPAPVLFAVFPDFLRQDVSNQDDIHEMLKIGEDLETRLAWLSKDKSNVTSMTSRNNHVWTVIQYQLRMT